MKKQYFLFGEKACEAFDSKDDIGVVNAIYCGDGQLFMLDLSNPDNALSLLGAYSGWNQFLQIPEDDFNDIEEGVQYERIGDWTASELFDWLQDNELIDEDEEIDNWYDSRGDMVDTVRDNIEIFFNERD